jgi:hypothetical protein
LVDGLGLHKAFVDANIPASGIVLLVMNDQSHPPHGKINLHGNGLGVPSPELVEVRAREIAMIDERDPDEFTEADWQQAKNELTGVGSSQVPEEVEEDVADERSERDEVLGASGHRAPRSGFDDEENVGEELVSGGIEEAAHDQMVEARREELDQERGDQQ